DYAGFVAAAGPLSTITFDTLPDGSPSFPGTPLTSTFNYDLQGAHFSSPPSSAQPPNPYIAGNTVTGFELQALMSNGSRTWIVADLTAPARSVGFFYPGGTTLYAYDANGALLGSATFGGAGDGHFLGIVSQATPIARVKVDRGSFIDDIE